MNGQQLYEQFETLYDEMYWRMLRLAYTILHNGEEARDVVHDVFARLLEGHLGLQAGVEPAYLLTCTRNASLNLLARRRLEERLGGEIVTELYDTSEANEEQWEQVEQAIEQVLSPQDRRVLQSCYEEGHSYRETAERMGISVSAVNKHIVKALRKLRNHLRTIVLAVALLLTGAAIALIVQRIVAFHAHSSELKPNVGRHPHEASRLSVKEMKHDVVQFTDVRLDSILAQMSRHYGLANVRFCNPDLQELRLYLQWNTDASLTETLDLLNRFNRVSVTLQGDMIVVE